MSATASEAIYRHGKDRNFTEEEYFTLSDELLDAIQSGDEETSRRLSAILPISPDVAKAFKDVYGKEYLLRSGVDLTEANLQFGEGWLDEPSEW